MRTMFDSTTPRNIPRTAALVMGYANGKYAWSARDWALWPPARHVFLSVNAWYHQAIVLDVEWGDATAQQANGWIIGSAPVTGWVPTLYGSKSKLDEARPLVAAAGLDCDWFLADPTRIPHLPAGYAACQYAWPGLGSPGHFDMSVVADWWPRAVGTPRPV